MEQKTKLLRMIRIQGGKLVAYWVATYLFHFTVYMCFAMLYMAAMFVTGIEMFTNSDVVALFFVYFFWGHAVVSYGIFLSSILNGTITSSIMGYMFIIGHSVFGFVFYLANLWPPELAFTPSLHFLKAYVAIVEDAGSSSTVVWGHIGLMFLTSTGFLMAGLAIHTIRLMLATGNLPPLQTMLWKTCRCSGCSGCGTGAAHAGTGGGTTTATNERQDGIELNDAHRVHKTENTEEQDVDVLAEAKRTQAIDPKTVGIQVLHVEKVFPPRPRCPPKKAVNDLSFHVKYDEVFGLLGPNGAGKTTTINMLSGSFTPTSGTAFIAGIELNPENITAIQTRLGVCPQFDTTWPSLTVQEHFKLYARMKGCSNDQLSATVQSMAEQVELDGDNFFKQSKELSGGMRRRLSIGIALIGNPTWCVPRRRVVSNIRCMFVFCLLFFFFSPVLFFFVHVFLLFFILILFLFVFCFSSISLLFPVSIPSLQCHVR